jgi:hypothetical protein
MIRKDDRGVDFGLWKSISPSILSCPLDVHSGNVARKPGLLTRKQNDSKAVSELAIIYETWIKRILSSTTLHCLVWEFLRDSNKHVASLLTYSFLIFDNFGLGFRATLIVI